MGHLPDMHGATPSQTPESAYADEAAKLDKLLDAGLAEIRRQSDAGLIGPSEAAYMRVGVMEQHLAEIRVLRIRHFGSTE